MGYKTRRSILYAVLVLILTLGVFTSYAGWANFGGGNQDGRLWSWDLTDLCLDGARVGFATNVYYNVDPVQGEQPDEAVWAKMSINSGFPEDIELMAPHWVHPPLQPSPILVGASERDYHTALNIPFQTPFNNPTVLTGYQVIPQGSSSGGSALDATDWTMEDCYLLKGVINGTFEAKQRTNTTLPLGWDTTKIGAGDRLMCDRVKHDTLPDKFYSYEGGIINTGSSLIDPDINPGCAFRFLGKPGKVSLLSQKNKNVADFEAGDMLTIVAHTYGKTTAKSNVQIKVQVKYPGAGNQQIITATTKPEDKINQAYIQYVGSVQLTGTPLFVKTTIRFDDPNGSLFVDGVYMRLDKAQLELTSPRGRSDGWITLPEVQN